VIVLVVVLVLVIDLVTFSGILVALVVYSRSITREKRRVQV